MPNLPKISGPGMGAIGATYGVASNIVSDIASSVKSSVVRASGVSSLSPSRIISATADAAGVGDIVNFSKMMKGGSGDKKVEENTKKTADATTATKEQVSRMTELTSENVAISKELLTAVTNANEANKEGLARLMAVVAGQKLSNIEASREARVPVAAANDNVVGQQPQQKDGKGILDGMLAGITGKIGSLLAPVGSVLTSMGGMLKGFAKFAGPIGIITGILSQTKAEDWDTLAGNFAKVLGDFLDGEWLQGLNRAIGSVGDILFKGVFRGLNNAADTILRTLGLEGLADALQVNIQQLEKLNLGNVINDSLNAITAALTEYKSQFVKGVDSFLEDPTGKKELERRQQESLRAQSAANREDKVNELVESAINQSEQLRQQDSQIAMAAGGGLGMDMSLEGRELSIGEAMLNNRIPEVKGIVESLRNDGIEVNQNEPVSKLRQYVADRSENIRVKSMNVQEITQNASQNAPIEDFTDKGFEAPAIPKDFNFERLKKIDAPAVPLPPVRPVNISGGTTINNISGGGSGTGRNSGAINTTAPRSPIDEINYGRAVAFT